MEADLEVGVEVMVEIVVEVREGVLDVPQIRE